MPATKTTKPAENKKPVPERTNRGPVPTKVGRKPVTIEVEKEQPAKKPVPTEVGIVIDNPPGFLTLEVIVPALDVHVYPTLNSPTVGVLMQGEIVRALDLYGPNELWVKIGKEQWAPVYLAGDRKLQV